MLDFKGMEKGWKGIPQWSTHILQVCSLHSCIPHWSLHLLNTDRIYSCKAIILHTSRNYFSLYLLFTVSKKSFT